MSDVAGNMSLIIFGLLLILILLFILKIVHEQATKVRELESQMKMMEAVKANDNQEEQN